MFLSVEIPPTVGDASTIYRYDAEGKARLIGGRPVA
jgi:hypothetical protein